MKLGKSSETFISKWLYSRLLPSLFKIFVAWEKTGLCICFQHFDLDSATLSVELMSITTICNETKPL